MKATKNLYASFSDVGSKRLTLDKFKIELIINQLLENTGSQGIVLWN